MFNIVEVLVVAFFFLMLGWSLPKVSWSPFPYDFKWGYTNDKPSVVLTCSVGYGPRTRIEFFKYRDKTWDNTVNATEVTESNVEMLRRYFEVELDVGDWLWLNDGETNSLPQAEFDECFVKVLS